MILHAIRHAPVRAAGTPLGRTASPPSPVCPLRLPHPSRTQGATTRRRKVPVISAVFSYGERVDEILVPPNTLEPRDVVSVNRKVGEGSFGQVFEATMEIRGRECKVIMKKMKPSVERSLEMGVVEIALNKTATQKAKGATAKFLGHMKVGRKDAKPSQGLSEGFWLVWEYQGFKTLDSYLRQRDFLQRLAADLEVSEDSAIPTVMKQILQALKSLHAARIVHRDVKPLNLLFCEDDKRFCFIDLGACVDMGNGTNFDPESSIFDPLYCAPEECILPSDTPDLAALSGPAQSIACMAAWGNRPDRFDMYSAGLVLVQMSIPKLRTPSSLKKFSESLAQYEYDVMAWAERQQLPPRETYLLDDNDGAGWKLAAALLRERVVEKGQPTVSGKILPRPSAAEALRFAFLKQADKRATLRSSLGDTEATGRSSGPSGGGWVGGLLQSWGFSTDEEDLGDADERVGSRAAGVRAGRAQGRQ